MTATLFEFERNRERLFAVAFRLLGSAAEAEDAVQEAWIRFSCSSNSEIHNHDAWLTTVVSRIALDQLRSRKSRKEEDLNPETIPMTGTKARDPERNAIMVESVGIALLVVLDRLTPAERLGFVLHDVFDLPFDEIAMILQRSPGTVRQLASRARKKVRGNVDPTQEGLTKQTRIAQKFLAAMRNRDLPELLSVLDPNLRVEIDASAALPGQPRSIQGARRWAEQAIVVSNGARFTQLASVDGAVGLLIAPQGRLLRVLRFQFNDDVISHINVVSDPENLVHLQLSVMRYSRTEVTVWGSRR